MDFGTAFSCRVVSQRLTRLRKSNGIREAEIKLARSADVSGQEFDKQSKDGEAMAL